MHREISHADQALAPNSRLSLYVLTALLGLLIGFDLWPLVAVWLGLPGWAVPGWMSSREILGLRWALVAAVLGGARILYGSIESLFEGRIGADLALAIACIAAILIREPLVAAEVVFIGMVGECLENFTFERTQRAIRKIVEVCPRRCWLLRDGQEVRVLTSELKVGDRVVVKPGGRVPVDGMVVDGRSAVDVSALTGESLPVDKGVGDEVLAGSLNQFGALTIDARRVAEHTVVGRVIELTARALKDKSPSERTADRLARFFLPAVLGLAAVTFFVTFVFNWLPVLRPGEITTLSLGEAARRAAYPTLAVLVVACPCALILATPAAVIAALGRLAGTGILIKGGKALERLAQVNAFAFDKTGTLTEGRLELGEVRGLDGVTADDVLTVAASAEQKSEHLLAKLIGHEAAVRKLPVENPSEFLAHPGAGVTARIGQSMVIVGTRRLLEEQGVQLAPAAVLLLDELDQTAQTTLLVARDGAVLGAIGARDRVRQEARAVLQELRDLGISDMALLTGDRARVAQGVAGELGIGEVHSELLPEQKADFVSRWSEKAGSAERTVAMMGDGINDAPALAGAAVGLALGGTGADVAAEAGDVVFMGDPLRPLPLLVRLSRETVRIIRQNILIFAFGVNAFGILVTAWLWPILAPAAWQTQAPLAAVIYHQLGSLAVLLNAMRLLWFERRPANPAMVKARHRLEAFDQWVEHHLNLDEFLHWLGHHWRPVTGALGALVLLAFAASGLTQIGPDEIGMSRRFGRVVDDNLQPGLHWRWPWPIEEIDRVQPERIHVVEIGFRTLGGVRREGASLSWSSPHGGDGLRRAPDEAVMITGDGNLVELQATVRYVIAQPRVYRFEVRDPDEVIRSMAESVLREIVASRSFHDLLSVGRATFQQEALRKLTSRLGNGGENGLGIRLEGVDLHEVHPLQEVVQSYHDVTKAMEARDQLVNQALGEALSQQRKAEGQALQLTREAEAAKNEKIDLARAAQAALLARLGARSRLPVEQEGALLGEALDDILSGRSSSAAFADYERRRNELIALQMALTDFRLFWDTLGRALAGRDKLLIDADQVPGRRQLLMFDLDQLRVPVPMMGLPDRGPRSTGPREEP
jgi:Cu+-exporting ATPase